MKINKKIISLILALLFIPNISYAQLIDGRQYLIKSDTIEEEEVKITLNKEFSVPKSKKPTITFGEITNSNGGQTTGSYFNRVGYFITDNQGQSFLIEGIFPENNKSTAYNSTYQPTIKSFSNGQLISTKKLDKFTLMRSTTEEIINSLYANYIKDKNPTPLTLSLMQTAQNEIKITLTAYTRWSFDLPRSNGVSNKPKSKDYYIGGTGLHQYYDNVNKYNLFLNSLGISKQNVNYLWKKKYYDIPFMTRYHAYITNTNVFKTFENKFLDDRIDYEETQKNYAAKTGKLPSTVQDIPVFSSLFSVNNTIRGNYTQYNIDYNSSNEITSKTGIPLIYIQSNGSLLNKESTWMTYKKYQINIKPPSNNNLSNNAQYDVAYEEIVPYRTVKVFDYNVPNDNINAIITTNVEKVSTKVEGGKLNVNLNVNGILQEGLDINRPEYIDFYQEDIDATVQVYDGKNRLIKEVTQAVNGNILNLNINNLEFDKDSIGTGKIVATIKWNNKIDYFSNLFSSYSKIVIDGQTITKDTVDTWLNNKKTELNNLINNYTNQKNNLNNQLSKIRNELLQKMQDKATLEDMYAIKPTTDLKEQIDNLANEINRLNNIIDNLNIELNEVIYAKNYNHALLQMYNSQEMLDIIDELKNSITRNEINTKVMPKERTITKEFTIFGASSITKN